MFYFKIIFMGDTYILKYIVYSYSNPFIVIYNSFTLETQTNSHIFATLMHSISRRNEKAFRTNSKSYLF